MACRALRVLARKPSRDDAVPVFIQALNDREDVIRKIAVGALAAWGRAADAALPKLELAMANDPSARLRSLAGYAFDEVAPPERRRPVVNW
jgi:HEAT repeats